MSSCDIKKNEPYVPKEQKFYTWGAIENLLSQGFRPDGEIEICGLKYKRYRLGNRIATATADGKYVNHIEG